MTPRYETGGDPQSITSNALRRSRYSGSTGVAGDRAEGVRQPHVSPSDLSRGPRQMITTAREIFKQHVGWGGGAVAFLLIAGLLALPDNLAPEATLTLAVFAVAVWMWMFSSLDDTLVALGAASVLVLTNVINVEGLFSTLGDEQTWLLIGAFIVAGAVGASGLATRAVVYLCQGRSSPRLLVHTLTLATVATAYAIPATSGRAALLIPVFLALAPHVGTPGLNKALSLILPSVILLSAVGALIGAGAHLITVQILENNGHSGLSFSEWLMLGLPFALVCSHIAAEQLLLQNTSRQERAQPVMIKKISVSGLLNQPLNQSESRILAVLTVTIVLWCTEGLHGVHPALVAVIAALVVTTPWAGVNDLGASIKKVPWSMILFMAATLALSSALVVSGAADFLANASLNSISQTSHRSVIFLVGIVVISTAAHLIIQSRSGRSAALIPLIIAISPVFGVNPVAAAFISTAAAGFCHSLPATAKPLALFSALREDHPEMPIFTQSDLRKFAVTFAPIFVVVTLIFAVLVWPALGLSVFL